MEEETLQIRCLVVVAAILCALIIGYNLFFTPEVKMTTVYVDAPSSGLDSGDSPAGAAVLESENSAEEPASSGIPMGGKININTASAEELDELPGVGPVLAGRIIDYREQNGGFQSLEQLKNVSGIGEAVFEKLKDFISLE